MNEITASALHARLVSGEELILIDVREPYEHEEYNIGGTNIPVTELPFRIDELRALGDHEIVLYCQSGNRSMLAQKLLATQFNIVNTTNLLGGARGWKEEMKSEE
ncbi:MAG: rhodanese-like domain-containing protein [Saprospiraceae bacterium]|nr:rhodanese-like domain-containing protein [Saprospiraceae bacterium]